MQKRKDDTRRAKRIINLTDKIVRMYNDQTGQIVEFAPQVSEVSDSERDVFGYPEVYYIVEAKDENTIKEEAALDNVTVVSIVGTGRGGVMVSRLKLVKNPEVAVVYIGTHQYEE